MMNGKRLRVDESTQPSRVVLQHFVLWLGTLQLLHWSRGGVAQTRHRSRGLNNKVESQSDSSGRIQRMLDLPVKALQTVARAIKELFR